MHFCTDGPHRFPALFGSDWWMHICGRSPVAFDSALGSSARGAHPTRRLHTPCPRAPRLIECGQATVEAAVMLPVLLAIFGLLLQPVILLYDRMVMQSAAGEACRLVATQTASDSAVTAFALRRLAAVPQTEIFHVGGDDGWDVAFDGGEFSDEVEVTITHEVDVLPLWGVVDGLGGTVKANGNCVQTVSVSASSQPAWACGLDDGPDDWIGDWQ